MQLVEARRQAAMGDLLGTLGVGLLLVAFGLDRVGRIPNRPYAALNACGSALACAASLLIGFVPFVVLEAIWCAVAIADLLLTPLRTRGPAS
jgi:hypothetical protein